MRQEESQSSWCSGLLPGDQLESSIHCILQLYLNSSWFIFETKSKTIQTETRSIQEILFSPHISPEELKMYTQILAAVGQFWGRGVWGAWAKGWGQRGGHQFWLVGGRQCDRQLRTAPWQSKTQLCTSDPFLCCRKLLVISCLHFLITRGIRSDCARAGSSFLTQLMPRSPKCKNYVYSTKWTRPFPFPWLSLLLIHPAVGSCPSAFTQFPKSSVSIDWEFQGPNPAMQHTGI